MAEVLPKTGNLTAVACLEKSCCSKERHVVIDMHRIDAADIVASDAAAVN